MSDYIDDIIGTYMLLGAVCVYATKEFPGKPGSRMRHIFVLSVMFFWPGYLIDKLVTRQVKKLRKADGGD